MLPSVGGAFTWLSIMDALDRLIPTPRLREHNAVEVAVPAERAWETVRHGDLARSQLIRLLFAARLLPDRLAGKHVEVALRMDEFRSSPEEPGFRIFVDDPPHEIAVGAIGKVWKQVIPFVHLSDAESFAAFAEPDHVKVAWAAR